MIEIYNYFTIELFHSILFKNLKIVKKDLKTRLKTLLFLISSFLTLEIKSYEFFEIRRLELNYF